MQSGIFLCVFQLVSPKTKKNISASCAQNPPNGKPAYLVKTFKLIQMFGCQLMQTCEKLGRIRKLGRACFIYTIP